MNILDFLNPLKIASLFTFNFGGGGGQSSAPANQNVTTSNIAPWAQPGVQSLISAGMQNVFPNYNPQTGNVGAQSGYTPFNASTTSSNPAGQQALSAAQSNVAGFSPLQQQAQQGVANLQVPEQYGQASGMTGYGTEQAFNAGNQYAQQATNPYAVASYMNPYLQQSLAPQLQLLAQQTGMQTADEQAAATRSGAFGGSREALMNSLRQQQGDLAAQQAIGQGYNQAFQNAQQAQQFGANLGLQGTQAGLSGAGQLANIGTNQLSAQQGILGLQNQFGGQQQQQQQNILNQAMQNYQTMQNYPMTQLGQLESLYTGAPQTVSQLSYQAAPNLLSTVAGLGTTALAANKLFAKEGGLMKGYKSGGLVDLAIKHAEEKA